MCNCRTDLEARLLERFKEAEPLATGHEVKLTGYAFIFGKQLRMVGVMPIEQTADFPLKKGGTKRKSVKCSMQFTHCPFCGDKYEAGKEDSEDTLS